MLLPLLATGCTTEGTLTDAATAECPETISVSAGSWTALTRNFVCTYEKTTNGGAIIAGFCQSRDVGIFNGKCQRLYTYTVPSEVSCGAHEYAQAADTCPNGQSGSCPCVCDAGYVRNQQTHVCETCPANSHDDGGQCTCDAGFDHDPDNGACVSLPPIGRGAALNRLVNPYPACPDHSARYSDGLCYCDAGYFSSYTVGTDTTANDATTFNYDHCWIPTPP